MHSGTHKQRSAAQNTTTFRRRGRRGAAVAALAATAGGVCALVAQAQDSTRPPTVGVKLTTGAPALTGAEALGTGPVTFKAASAKGERSFTLVRVTDGVDPEQLAAALDKVKGEDAIEAERAKFKIVIDGRASPKHAYQATGELTPGSYIALDTTRQRGTPHTVFSVGSTPSGAAAPKPDATVDMADYKFTVSRSLKAGGIVRFRNRGKAFHMAISFKVQSPKAAAELTAGLKKKGANPEKLFPKYVRGTGTGVDPVSDGTSSDVRIADKPGNYVFVCFWGSKQSGGKPHFAKGMVKAYKVVK